MRPTLPLLLLLALPSCGDDGVCPAGYRRQEGVCVTPAGDAGSDAGSDAGREPGRDAGSDAGSDAGNDAGSDAGADCGVAAGAEECNGLDDDCDGVVPADEADVDGDDYRICGGDCADDDGARHPGAVEVCNGLDDDCADGVPADEADGDGDTYRLCSGDCDDDDGARHPGAAEACNGIDDDCADGVPADEVDGDGDDYRICDDDCADDDPVVNPGQVAYFEEPYGPDPGSWDYDCDGEETMRRTSIGCSPPDLAGNCGVDHWCNAVPACGERQYRVANCISCNPTCDETDDVQTCR